MNRKKFWEWLKFAFLLLTLIVGVVFLHQWWNREQKLKELETRLNQLERNQKEAKEKYQIQQKQLSNITSLAQKPELQKFFTNLLQTYARKFATSKKINIADYSLAFGGFYYHKENTIKEAQTKELGNASFDPKTKQTIIKLNQLFLFNKLGHQKYFASPEFHLEIDFNSLLKTISHELAHYFQFVKDGESSCQSDLGTKQYIDWLAQEHKEFTQQINQLITASPNYADWEKQWNEVQC